MRFDVAVPCFFGGTDFCDAVEKIAALGFSAIESYDWKNLDIPRVSEVCKKNNVNFISLCTSEFNLTDESFRKVWLDGLEESCAAAVRLGVNKLITQSGPDTGKERAFQHENIVTTLSLAKPILEKYSVTVMLEPLNTIVDHKGTYLYSSQEAFDIVRQVSNPLVKVVYDIYHQQITEGNIIANLTANIDCVAHIHAAGTPGRHELHSGECDYRNIFAAVDKCGYQGYCGLEYGPLLEPVQSLKTVLEYYAE